MMIYVDTDRCSGCGACVTACPVEAINLENGKALIDERKCVFCFACVGECPQQAIIAVEAVEPQISASSPTTLSKLIPASPVKVAPTSITTNRLAQKALLPAISGALLWVGQAVLPRVLPGLAGRLGRSPSNQPGGQQRRLRKRQCQK